MPPRISMVKPMSTFIWPLFSAVQSVKPFGILRQYFHLVVFIQVPAEHRTICIPGVGISPGEQRDRPVATAATPVGSEMTQHEFNTGIKILRPPFPSFTRGRSQSRDLHIEIGMPRGLFHQRRPIAVLQSVYHGRRVS